MPDTLPPIEDLWTISNDADARAWGIAYGEATDPGSAAAEVAALNGVRCAMLALTRAVMDATAPPATDVQPIAAEEGPREIAAWAEIELMGHRRVIGRLEEVEVAGRPMLYVRRLQRTNRSAGLGEPVPPLELEHPGRVYNPSALFSFRALTEEEARPAAIEALRTWHAQADDDEIPF